MLSSLRGRFVLILIIVAISGWQLYSKGLKQGLDLQGGAAAGINALQISIC